MSGVHPAALELPPLVAAAAVALPPLVAAAAAADRCRCMGWSYLLMCLCRRPYGAWQ